MSICVGVSACLCVYEMFLYPQSSFQGGEETLNAKNSFQPWTRAGDWSGRVSRSGLGPHTYIQC